MKAIKSLEKKKSEKWINQPTRIESQDDQMDRETKFSVSNCDGEAFGIKNGARAKNRILGMDMESAPLPVSPLPIPY